MKLKPWKVKGFVLEEDSFSILKDFYYEGPNGGKHKEIMDFVEVLETGHICLYKHYTNIQSSPNGIGPNGNPAQIGIIDSWDLVNYLLTSKGSSNIMLVRKKNQKKFKEQMVIYFQSYPTFLSKIEATEFSWETLPSLIAEFNQFKKNSP